ncbi:MAG: phosphoribosylformylglycinamidine synthase [Oligosphaeraceae bacterium]|nr:phosphoribosylformylglycinamidine synthase [Oligosphaeraceae bacterium]
MGTVRRVLVEKRPGFDIEAQQLRADLQEHLGLAELREVRIFKRYDLAGINAREFAAARDSILSEPNCDFVYEHALPDLPGSSLLAVEYLPGQYDQRADSAAQCVQLLTRGERPLVRSATVYALTPALHRSALEQVRQYLINPVESREASMAIPETLETSSDIPADIGTLAGFLTLTTEELATLRREMGMAMSSADLAFCQQYFRDQERREPTYTEIKVIDTYWSDHCRHTTFQTVLDQVEFEPGKYTAAIRLDYERYLALRQSLGRQNRDLCLMDLATIGARELKRQGRLDNLDASEEINACSIVIEADLDGRQEPWLIMFKNETHNHPTEIEPFGGAATCLGGAIRDPLSGRSYVYQAMRISGAADPRAKLSETLPGKLPQRKITRSAAAGYSSYGNQIGLAAGKVQEVYHPGFVAKRMELGAVIAAAPQANVLRQRPQPGDAILLIGGRTGRDGCGGATGSSKAHTGESLQSCGAEVQKGNPLTERNIQRLFRTAEFARLVKRCNDFGAGGVCVAIGELAPGLEVDLDRVPKKYAGLDGTELAISESQERMAVVIAAEEVERAIAMARAENLEATLVAWVSADPRLQMTWRGKTIVSLSREFLDSNGVTQHAAARITEPESAANPFLPRAIQSFPAEWLQTLRDLNVCSQKGLIEHFDGTIGAATVLSPYGGKYRLTPNEAMAAKIPCLGQTETCTLMSHGYNPVIASWSPYHGALYAVVEAIAKIAAAGGDVTQVRLSLQEYFERLKDVPERWGKPLAALLGALRGQLEFGTAAIGGKDSMSGSFNDLDVPPTLVAFAVTSAKADKMISPEYKNAGSCISLLPAPRDHHEIPDFDTLRKNYCQLYQWIQSGQVRAAHTVGHGGIAAAVSRMCFGNRLGLEIDSSWKAAELFCPEYGAIILESDHPLPGTRRLGQTTQVQEIRWAEQRLPLEQALAAWQEPLESVFPTRASEPAPPLWQPWTERSRSRPRQRVIRPRVLIPVFPGTNCEVDTARAFTRAGAIAECLLIRNLTAVDIEQSVSALVQAINQAQIIAFPGGFSGGDEPDGSGKFIATTFRNPLVAEAMARLLQERDGLVLGICNGFQALIKLGLVPYGEIRPALAPADPTLTFNNLGRHAATMVNTVVTSVKSPWLAKTAVGEVHAVAISHGEGRFSASEAQLRSLLATGQVAFQYADLDGRPAAGLPWNPNGSACAIEGITSPDGRVLGKMGHSERSIDSNIAINIPGNKEQGIFAAGVEYFS